MQRLRTSAVVALLALSVTAGAILISKGAPGRPVPVNSSVLLESVIRGIERGYIDSTVNDGLYGLAMKGMLRELGDPNATWIDQQRYSLLRERSASAIADAGLTVNERDGYIVVVSPIAGSSAERAGIRMGDRIAQVNGSSTRGMSAEEVHMAIQGSPGSSVTVLIERPGVASRLSIPLTREILAEVPVRAAFMLTSDVGYVRLDPISARTPGALGAAIDTLRLSSMATLVVDLRGIAGGVPEQGVEVADLFLPEGSRIAALRGRTNGEGQFFVDRTEAKWANLELIVLVDEGTSSASEVVAGALQDLDRALVIGRPTHGFANRQEIVDLSDGSALILTTARWLTPLGRVLDVLPLPAAPRTARRDTTPPRPEYKTASGRVVTGGGGIHPDVLIRLRTPDPLAGVVRSDFYRKGNEATIVESDGDVKAAVSIATQGSGQAELFARAAMGEWSDLDDGSH